METKTKRVFTRENDPTNEIHETVEKIYMGVKLQYEEVYYLDYVVDEDTGLINKDVKEKYYTTSQMERNLKALKTAYHVAKGSASPSEIRNFRSKYEISASTLSIVLGFSKNTISNIENEGVSSLTSGRLIKMCLGDPNIVEQYVQLCDLLDSSKKEEISKRLREVCH